MQNRSELRMSLFRLLRVIYQFQTLKAHASTFREAEQGVQFVREKGTLSVPELVPNVQYVLFDSDARLLFSLPDLGLDYFHQRL